MPITSSGRRSWGGAAHPFPSPRNHRGKWPETRLRKLRPRRIGPSAMHCAKCYPFYLWLSINKITTVISWMALLHHVKLKIIFLSGFFEGEGGKDQFLISRFFRRPIKRGSKTSFSLAEEQGVEIKGKKNLFFSVKKSINVFKYQ